MTATDGLYKLFDAVKLIVFESGGDGDGWIVSEHYKELADIFHDYEMEHGNWFHQRYDTDVYISFGHDQEAIIFVRVRDTVPSWAGDIIVEVPWIHSFIREESPC